MGRLALSMPGPLPCTPAGIEALLAHYEIPVAGRHVVIVGRGFTLGRPLALLHVGQAPDTRTRRSPSCTPACRTCTTTRGRPTSSSPPPACPGIIQPEHVKPGLGGHRRRRQLRGHERCCPTSPRSAKRSPAGSRRASAASVPPRSRCCSATASRRPSAAPDGELMTHIHELLAAGRRSPSSSSRPRPTPSRPRSSRRCATSSRSTRRSCRSPTAAAARRGSARPTSSPDWERPRL